MPKTRSKEYCAVTIDFVEALSDKAILVGFEDRKLWIPKSVIFEDDVPEGRSGEESEINIEAWFAKKEGMR